MKSKKLSKLSLKLSLILVNYKVGRHLISCIESIEADVHNVPFEVVIVENGTENLSKKLKKYKFVKYIKSPKNLGFGAGNNLGAGYATGEYLFFLNPDTIVRSGAIDELVSYLDKHKKVGIAAPLLLNPKGVPYPLQGTEVLTPLKAIFSYSFLNKIFPNNPFSRKFWMKGWDKTKKKEVDVVPGTAFMVRSEIFKRVNGFDEKFFLYFEEYDLSERVKKLGFKIFIIPTAKVLHLWGESTKKSRLPIGSIFRQSRFYYFRKHFGLIAALLVTFFLGWSKYSLFLFAILVLGAFLRFYGLGDDFSLIEDQEWFYSSAQRMLRGEIPLVGIASSQTWLHQGPLWTYMLAPVLYISNFNQLSGAYLTATLGIISIFLIYKIGEELESGKLAVVASFLYATSPIVILSDRFSYHTSPIPLVVLLLIVSLIKWVKGSVKYFSIALLSMSLLYNFELATVVFWPVILILLLLGWTSKEVFFTKLINVKMIVFSLILLIIPMIPIIIYDISHGFLQTLKYAHWVLYHKIFRILLGQNPSSLPSSSEAIVFLGDKVTHLFFFKNHALSIVLILLSFVNLLRVKRDKPHLVIALCTAFPMIGFIFNGVQSDAYLPMLFPGVILSTAILLDKLLKSKIVHVLTLNKLLILIVALGVFLRFFRIEQNFIFSAEIGDNLLAIKSVYLQGILPLIGPPTSHHWLDFGPLFYWMYGPFLVLSDFNPYSHAHFGAFISVLTIPVTYFVVSKIVNMRVGLLSAFLTAISFHFLELSRVARFFSIIPLLVLVYIYFLEQVARGHDRYFTLGFIFGTMINFHYSVLILIPFSIIYLYIRRINIFKMILKFVLGALIPLLPFIVYDIAHGFEMVSKLVLWIPYRILGFVGLYPKNTATSKAISETTAGFFDFFSSIILPDTSMVLGSILAIVIFVFLLIKTAKIIMEKNYASIYFLLFLWFVCGSAALIIHGSVPNHYYLPLIPIPIILFAHFLNELWERGFRIVTTLVLLLVLYVNMSFLFSNLWFYKQEAKASVANIPFDLQKNVTKKIIEDAAGRKFSLARVGPLDFFEEQYSQNYIYLLWWYGNEPNRESKLTYVIVEEDYPYDKKDKAIKVGQFANISIYKEINERE